MLVADILTQVRERLGDIKKQRWSDARLISIASDCNIEMCIKARLLRYQYYLPMVARTARYILPMDCINITKLQHLGEALPIYTRSDIDNGTVIKSSTGFVGIKSNINMNILELYPEVPDIAPLKTVTDQSYKLTSIDTSPKYGVASRVYNQPDTAEFVIEPFYGVTSEVRLIYTGIDEHKYGELSSVAYDGTIAVADMTQIEGVMTEIDYNIAAINHELYGYLTGVIGAEHNEIVSNYYGITTDIAFEENVVKVYYDAAPPVLTLLESGLQVPDMWRDLVMRYVVGTALQDDNDANNLQRGEAELNKYYVGLQELQTRSSSDFATNNKERYITKFRSV